ncbi:MAG: hypothetical protein M3Y57_10715 [Acidobacteriota bacterium]|nr:hypothetical protein [Acidobacteriota bacterium]
MLVLAHGLRCAEITFKGCPSVPQGESCNITFNKKVNLALVGGGALSCAQNCRSVMFSAPPSITMYNLSNRAGCPIRPIDSIFYTRIDSMPINANSNAWVSNIQALQGTSAKVSLSSVEFGLAIADNATPVTKYTFHYNSAADAILFPNPPRAAWKREIGNFIFDGETDHHSGFVNRQTCAFYELYNEVGNNETDPHDPNGFNAGSGGTYGAYTSSPYGTTNGPTGVDGTEYLDLVLSADDAKYGLYHPVSFVIPQYVCSPSQGLGGNDACRCKSCVASVGGAAGQASACGYAWPATYTSLGSNVATCGSRPNPPMNTLPGQGSWMRLKRSWCSTNIARYSGIELNILTGLCHYGAILTDWGQCCASKADLDIYRDPAILKAINTISSLLIFSNWEFVNVSALSTCSPWWECGPSPMYAAVNPSNGYQKINGYSVITATEVGSGSAVARHIAVLPVTVGTLHPFLIIPAGSQPNYQLMAYVNGSTNHKVTWSGKNVSSSGLFTITTSVSSPSVYDLTATATADPAASTHVNIWVIPNPSANAEGIYIDSGLTSGTTKDADNHVWITDSIPALASGYNFNFSDPGWPASNPLHTQWESGWNATYGGDVEYGDFVLPPGNYDVTFMSNVSNSPYKMCPSTAQSVNNYTTSSPTVNGWDVGQLIVTENDSIGGHVEFGLQNKVAPYLCHQPQFYTFPAKVKSDGILNVALRAQTQRNGSNTANVGYKHAVWINGAFITPDKTTRPHWAIDNQGYPNVQPGGKLQLYLIDWFTGTGATNATTAYGASYAANDLAGDATWSIVSGPPGGTISPGGLYAAPPSVAATTPVVIQISNGRQSASTTLYVVGKQSRAAVHQ